MPDSARTLIRSRPILPPPIPPQETEAKAYSARPQPVDYGLTCDDLNLYSTWASRNAWSCRLDDGKVVRCFGTRPDDRYKKGRRWFWIVHYWKAQAYTVGGLAFWVLLFGILATTSKDSRLAGVVLLGVALLCLLYAILPSVALKRLRERASPALEAYWRALHKYDEEKAAAEAAAREAARNAELRKRSYWEFLDGYAFETSDRRSPFQASVQFGGHPRFRRRRHRHRSNKERSQGSRSV